MSKTYSLSSVILLIALQACASSASAGAVYSCSDASGKNVFQQVPCGLDSLGSLADIQASQTARRQDAVLQASSADYAGRIKALEAMMASDEKRNQVVLEVHGDQARAAADPSPATK